MLRFRKIDSLSALYLRGGFFRRAGAMRSLAARFADTPHDVLAISEITPGDALAFATRFNLQWAYRGSQALFWNDRLEHARCSEIYLPLKLTRPFARQAFLRVDADAGSVPLTIGITQLSSDRRLRAAEMRFLRTEIRSAQERAMLFVLCDDPEMQLLLPDWDIAAQRGALRFAVRAMGTKPAATAETEPELACILQV